MTHVFEGIVRSVTERTDNNDVQEPVETKTTSFQSHIEWKEGKYNYKSVTVPCKMTPGQKAFVIVTDKSIDELTVEPTDKLTDVF